MNKIIKYIILFVISLSLIIGCSTLQDNGVRQHDSTIDQQIIERIKNAQRR